MKIRMLPFRPIFPAIILVGAITCIYATFNAPKSSSDMWIFAAEFAVLFFAGKHIYRGYHLHRLIAASLEDEELAHECHERIPHFEIQVRRYTTYVE